MCTSIFNEGDVEIELLRDRSIRLSEQHKIDGCVKANDARRSLRVAALERFSWLVSPAQTQRRTVNYTTKLQ